MVLDGAAPRKSPFFGDFGDLGMREKQLPTLNYSSGFGVALHLTGTQLMGMDFWSKAPRNGSIAQVLPSQEPQRHPPPIPAGILHGIYP